MVMLARVSLVDVFVVGGISAGLPTPLDGSARDVAAATDHPEAEGKHMSALRHQ